MGDGDGKLGLNLIKEVIYYRHICFGKGRPSEGFVGLCYVVSCICCALWKAPGVTEAVG